LGTSVWLTGEVELGLPSLGVVGFGSGALGIWSGLGLGSGPAFGPASVLGLYLLGVGSLLGMTGYPSCLAGARVRGSLMVPYFHAPGEYS